MRLTWSVLGLLILLSTFSFSQSTGINQRTPNPKAALHVRAVGKQGILIPTLRASDTLLFGATGADKGLTFYDSVSANFCYWTGARWKTFPGPASPSIGVGNTNQIAYWDTPSTLGSSNLTLVGNKIGLNVNPSAGIYTLQVNDPTEVMGALQLTAGSITGTGAANGLIVSSSPLSAGILNYENTPLYFGTSAVNVFNLTPAGKIQVPYLVGPGFVTADASGILAMSTAAPVTGAGTIGRVPVWTGSGTLSNSQITDDGSSVYIGTVGANPKADLYISRANPASLKLSNTAAAASMALRTGYTASMVNLLEFSHDLVFSSVTNANVGIGSSPVNYVRITSLGDMGVGINPIARLHVSTTGTLSTIIQGSNAAGTWIPIYNSTSGDWFSIIATGTANGEGPGKLMFCQNTFAGQVSGHFMTLDHATTNIGMGTNDPAYKLHVVGTAAKTGGGVWTTPSDIRIKENIAPFKEGLSTLAGIEPVSFYYNGKAGIPKGEKQYGVIAQEIQKVAPYTVTQTYKAKLNPSDEKETDLMAFDSGPLLYVLINSVKELNVKVDALQTELNAVKKQNELLKKNTEADRASAK